MTLEPDIMEKLVANYMAYWDKADIDGLMSMYDQSMQYHDMPSGEVIDYPELKQFLIDTFADKADQNLKLKESVFLEGNSAFLYWTRNFIATDTGKNVTINGVELIVFRSGKINSIHEFYDFQGTGSESVSPPSGGTLAEKMTKLGLSDETMKQLCDELVDYLDRDKPYLLAELTLATVSEHLGYTRNQVSFVINQVLDRTFYDLVNTKRVDHVISKMTDGNQNLSILELGFDAGFNSVSGFYNAFKKQTGITPAQYQRNLKC